MAPAISGLSACEHDTAHMDLRKMLEGLHLLPFCHFSGLSCALFARCHQTGRRWSACVEREQWQWHLLVLNTGSSTTQPRIHKRATANLENAACRECNSNPASLTFRDGAFLDKHCATRLAEPSHCQDGTCIQRSVQSWLRHSLPAQVAKVAAPPLLPALTLEIRTSPPD